MSEAPAKHPRFRFTLRTLFIVVTALCMYVGFVVAAFRYAIGPRRYMEWRYQVHQGTITDDELRSQVGDEQYRAYRDFIDSIPPLPPR